VSTAHVLLTVAGTGCEVVGLTWIVFDVSRARAAEFGERGVFRRIYDWFAYWLGPPTQTVSASVRLSGGGSMAMAGGGTVTVNESDLERLSRELAELRARVERGEQVTSTRFAELAERINAVESEMRERVEELHQRERELRRSGLTLQKRGAQLFIFGALLSGAANLVA
jgi:hypothetical protein